MILWGLSGVGHCRDSEVILWGFSRVGHLGIFRGCVLGHSRDSEGLGLWSWALQGLNSLAWVPGDQAETGGGVEAELEIQQPHTEGGEMYVHV